VAIVVRSTPASAAACTVVSWPVNIRTHRSYFCSADKNRFARRPFNDIGILLHEVPTPSQLWSERTRTLSREVSGNPHAGHTVSMRVRKRIEEPFGWIKTIGGGRKLRYIGRERNRAWFKITAAVYNLIRITALDTKPA
jgi:hypothetical protein